MPDPHRIERELCELLSDSWYASLFHQRNQFRNPKHPPETPATLAARTTKWIMENNPLLDPVTVEERSRPGIEFYRAHDGGRDIVRRTAEKIHPTSGTLGGSWVERSVMQTIWSATQRWEGKGRDEEFMEILRAANFIHPKWNHMKEIACMQVPDGLRVVVIGGRGSWKALRSQPDNPLTPDKALPPGKPVTPKITSQGDVIDVLGMMPIPGTYQCLVPLYNDMWVRSVPRGSPGWPLLS